MHLYLSYKKKFVIAYLDNYKGKKVSFKKCKEIPDKLKHFATIQFDNNILLCGGLNCKLENPEDVFSQQFDYTYNDAFLFNVKQTHQQLQKPLHLKMTMNRAKHCLTQLQDPRDPFNKLVLVIGGVYVTYKRDLFLKSTSMKHHDTATVEYYSLKTRTFERYNAKLSIARHSAAACSLMDYVYVIGGHTVD